MQNRADLLQDEVDSCNMNCSSWKWKLTFMGEEIRYFPAQFFFWLVGCLIGYLFALGFRWLFFNTLDVLFLLLANEVFCFLMDLYV